MNAAAFPPPGRKVLIGMVHLLPLPGSPGWGGSMQRVLEQALADAEQLMTAGFDALMIENFGDAPFYPERVPPETVAAMALVAGAIGSSAALPFGINVLRNDASAALAVAAVVGARFIRVNVHTGALLTDQGWIAGRAYETLRDRDRLRAQVAICADVLVKHAVALPGVIIDETARETFQRGRADVLIVSGIATGAPTRADDVLAVKRAVPDAPVWIGSGLTPPNARALFDVADGAIVGSALKRNSDPLQPVDAGKARELVQAIRG